MVLRLSIVLVIVALIQAVPVFELEREWTQFMAEFHPEYKNLAEFEFRKQIFKTKLQEIKKHNAEYDLGLHTYRKGINQFSDKTNEEKRRLLTGFKGFSRRDYLQPKEKIFELKTNEDIPESIDWRARGAVTPIKNQKHCGSCWAFSTIGAIEGQYFLATNKSVSLSEQQLVDCSESNDGCHGGDMELAYVDLRKLGGVATADSYSYKAEDRKCKYNQKMAVAGVAGYVAIPQNEEALKQAVSLHGPISVAIEVTANFHDYTGGILYDEDCTHDLNEIGHAVLVVGYGSENGTDYWIVKNSWGKRFGERGYIKMARNRNNTCQIATYTSFPLVKAVK